MPQIKLAIWLLCPLWWVTGWRFHFFGVQRFWPSFLWSICCCLVSLLQLATESFPVLDFPHPLLLGKVGGSLLLPFEAFSHSWQISGLQGSCALRHCTSPQEHRNHGVWCDNLPSCIWGFVASHSNLRRSQVPSDKDISWQVPQQHHTSVHLTDKLYTYIQFQPASPICLPWPLRQSEVFHSFCSLQRLFKGTSQSHMQTVEWGTALAMADIVQWCLTVLAG